MKRLAYLLDQTADFQTRTLACALAGAFKESTTLTLSAGSKLHISWLWGRGPTDIIHSFSPHGLVAAALASKARIIYTPSPEAKTTGVRWAWRLCRRRNLTTLFSDEFSRARAIADGMNPRNCRLIPPGVCLPQRQDRDAVRRALRLSDDDFVVLAPGESTRCARHSLALWTLAILHETDPRWKMLAWGRGPQKAELSRLAERMKHRSMLHTAEKMNFEDVLPAADAAMISATGGAAILPVAMSMTAGLAIVATPHEALTDKRNALVIEGDSPRAAAQALLELRGDAALRAQLGAQAQVDAQDRFSMERFVEDHRKIYSELM